MENKTVYLLKRARKLIKNGAETFLCLALKTAVPNGDNEARIARDHLCDRIMTELRTCGPGVLSVDSWLRKKCPEFRAWRDSIEDGSGLVYRQDEYTKVMREYRLRWIDELIKQHQ